MAYRKYLPEKGWDAAETVPDTSSANDYAAARADVSDGQVDVAWTRHTGLSGGDQVRHSRVASARQATSNLTGSEPSSGITSTVSNDVDDDHTPTLTSATKVVDCTGNAVRTLRSGSKGRGHRGISWDGKNDAGAALSPGDYTLQDDDTGMDSLAAHGKGHAQVSQRQASTTYSYDLLYRLTREAAPEGTSSYTYDLVGNRASKTLCGATVSYSYAFDNAGNARATISKSQLDRADRIQSVSATVGTKTTTVSYVANADGNLVQRGHHTAAASTYFRRTDQIPARASHTAPSMIPPAATSNVGRRPIASPGAPPASAPNGITPREMTCSVAFTRPSRWSGVLTCLSVSAFTSYSGWIRSRA